MKNQSNNIVILFHVLFWIIFVGLCLETGTQIVSFVLKLFWHYNVNPKLHYEPSFVDVFAKNPKYYIGLKSFTIAILVLKTYMTYLVLKIFAVFKLENPFKEKTSRLIGWISVLALETGILSVIAAGYSDWLVKRDVLNQQVEWGGNELLFLAGIIYILGMVFRRGVEIQSEQELTI